MKLNAERREAESVRSHVAPPEPDGNDVSHSHVTIHRLLEMG